MSMPTSVDGAMSMLATLAAATTSSAATVHRGHSGTVMYLAKTIVLVGALYSGLASLRELVAASVSSGGLEARYKDSGIVIPAKTKKHKHGETSGDDSDRLGEQGGEATAKTPAASTAIGVQGRRRLLAVPKTAKKPKTAVLYC